MDLAVTLFLESAAAAKILSRASKSALVYLSKYPSSELLPAEYALGDFGLLPLCATEYDIRKQISLSYVDEVSPGPHPWTWDRPLSNAWEKFLEQWKQFCNCFSMIRNPLNFMLTFLFFLSLQATATSAGEPASGGQIALRWCSTCHLVSEDQTSASADAPTFRSIAAKYGDESDALAAFLADPHPPMPNMSLTRREIRDLVAYIGSLQ